jgi:hypothetical protein
VSEIGVSVQNRTLLPVQPDLMRLEVTMDVQIVALQALDVLECVLSFCPRRRGHGIAAAVGKLGGFAGFFVFPYLLAWKGLLGAESAAAIASALGLIVTLTMLPETMGKSLEEIESETGASATESAAADSPPVPSGTSSPP